MKKKKNSIPPFLKKAFALREMKHLYKFLEKYKGSRYDFFHPPMCVVFKTEEGSCANCPLRHRSWCILKSNDVYKAAQKAAGIKCNRIITDWHIAQVAMPFKQLKSVVESLIAELAEL